jgi:DNA-binding transcriptional ArsR family regulator
MTLLKLSPTAVVRSRFALSPLAETVSSLIALQRPGPDPWLASWHARHQAGYRQWRDRDEVAAGLLPLMAATKWLPDFVALPPGDGVHTRLTDELAAVAEHSDTQIRAMTGDAIAAGWGPRPTRWLSGDRLGPRVAAMLGEGWERFVAPDWPRRRAVLERDIAYRAGLLAAYGWPRAVADITRKSAWVSHDTIRFSDQGHPDRFIGDHGLIFVPHTPGGGFWLCERPPQFAFVYSARGPAAPPDPADPDPLAGLLGAGRARIARELTRPATSSQLAHSLGVSLGTVSAHLAVLRDTGVVAGARTGRSVIYRLTERGERLLSVLD